jgi:hypothetical protein
MNLKQLLFLFVLFCVLVAPVSAQNRPLVRDLDPRYATEWIDLVYMRVQAERESPTTSSRVYGYAGVTLYESLVGGMPDYVSLTEQIGHMPDFPRTEADVTYDWITVMDSTMATVLPTVFTAVTPETIAAFEELRDTHTEERRTESDPETIDRSLAYGVELGEAIAAWAADDGFADVRTHGQEYVLPEGDGYYVLTSEGTRPNQPYWGEMRPFVLETASACNVLVDVPYSTDPDSVFYAQAHATLVTRGRNDYGTDNSLYAVLMADRQTVSQVLANCITPLKWDDNLHVLPASPLLEQAERELQGTAGAPYRLADPLAKIAPHYAAVVIDTRPSFSLMTEMALISSTDAIVPVEPRYLETVGLLSVIGKSTRFGMAGASRTCE